MDRSGLMSRSFSTIPDARQTFRDQVDDFLDSDKFSGLMIDFEAFPKSGRSLGFSRS